MPKKRSTPKAVVKKSSATKTLTKRFSPADPDQTRYVSVLTDLTQLIHDSRRRALATVNRELVCLYWHNGRTIVEQQETANWGDAVVEQLATDLRAAFPDMKGFSRDNVFRMRQFFVVCRETDRWFQKTFTETTMARSRWLSATRCSERARRLTRCNPPDERKASNWFTVGSVPRSARSWRERFLSRAACTADVDRIVVATQVVEAGVDISAGCLVTELAPWPSLVQRFGRCARYGGSGRVLVVDRGRDEKSAPPYAAEELESAWAALETLQDVGVGIASLEAHEESLTPEGRERLFPYSPSHLLLRREFDELFDTTPDLTGADLDISRFIRSGDERDLQVFWIELDKDESPATKRQPQRQELCSVPFLDVRDWLCGEETKTNRKPKLKANTRAWVWDWLDGEWTEANRASVLPGRIVCVAASCGGYRVDRGFDPDASDDVPVVSSTEAPTETQALNQADNRQDGENLSFLNEWKTIACHSGEVTGIATEIATALSLRGDIQKVLALAGRWHDVGKSHPAFQGALRSKGELLRPDRQDLAKGPEGCWLRPVGTYRYADGSDSRPAFRHELASALALFAVLETFQPQHPAILGTWGEALQLLGHSITALAPTAAPPPSIQQILDCSADEFNLLVYLVASHHGKVRAGLHAAPKDQDYRDRDHRGLPIRGVREGDRLPGVCLDSAAAPLPELSLTLEPAALGLSTRTGASWRERCDQLLTQFGPGGLAFLESLLRAADVRASRLRTNDPALQNEVSA